MIVPLIEIKLLRKIQNIDYIQYMPKIIQQTLTKQHKTPQCMLLMIKIKINYLIKYIYLFQ